MSDPRSDGSHGDAAQVIAGVDALVRRDETGRFTLKRPGGWQMVPVEGSSHLSPQNIQRFAAAFKWLGAAEVHAVALELRDEIEPVRDFSASEAGLDAFNRACAHFNYALTANDCAVLIICTTDDHMVIGGPGQFVHLAAGTTTAARALEELHRYATDPGQIPRMREMLESVWRSLSAAGRSIVFPE